MFCALVEQLWGREGPAAQPRGGWPKALPAFAIHMSWRRLALSRSSDCPPAAPYPGLRCAASPSRSSPSPAGLVCAARRWPGWHCGPAGKSVPLPVSGRCRALLQRHTSWGHGEHREQGGGCVPRVCTGSVRLSFGNRQACYLRARPPSSNVLNIFHVPGGGLNALQELIRSVFSTTWSVFS